MNGVEAWLAVLIHVDGHGARPDRAGTWATLRASAPQVRWWGWKSFVDEDHPTLDPTQAHQVQPAPDLVTYREAGSATAAVTCLDSRDRPEE